MSEANLTNANAYRRQEILRLQDQNRQLQDEVRTLNEFIRALDELYALGDEFKDDSELLPFLRSTLEMAMRLLKSSDASLALFDEEKQDLVFVIVHGELADELVGTRIPIDQGIIGWVARNAKPTLISNVRGDLRFSASVDDQFSYRTESIVAAPLVGDGKVYGVVEVLNMRTDEAGMQQGLTLLKLMCRVAGEVLGMIDQHKVT